MNKFKLAWNVLRTRGSDVDLSAANNLFGTIGRGIVPISTQMGFIPTDGHGSTMDLTGNASPQWLGLSTKSMQYWAYKLCSPLGTVIDRLAEADTNGRIEFVDEDGNTIKKTTISKTPNLNRVKKLLLQPNPFQTWEEFNSQQVVLCKIFGYCPVFALGPGISDKTMTRSLWNLNPMYCTPQQNSEFDLYGSENETNPIKEWIITIFGKSYTIPASDIMLLKDGYIDSDLQYLGLPLSKVSGLDFFVSNICAAMEADNVLLKKKGPLGVFSHDPRPDNMAGRIPMTPADKKEIQDDLSRYGLTLGQLQYIISKEPLKWNAMSFDLQKLMTKETVRQGIDVICDRFSYPAELMSGKNATYENRDSAEKYLYQNNVIPFLLRRMSRYCKFFGITGLVLDYDHLPVLQDDILKAGQASEAESNGLLVEWQAGMITWNQWQKAKGRDTVAGMDIFYPEWFEKFGKSLQKETTKQDGKKQAA